MNDYKELLSRIVYCASADNCAGCPLDSEDTSEICVDKLLKKAADAIEQLCKDVERLEAENRAKEQYIVETIGKVIKERDVAIADLKNVRPCIACKHIGFGLEHCKHCFSDNCFEWRGVQEVQNNGRFD